MNVPIYVVSQTTLQRWTRHTPNTTGVGGSETAHIEMAEGLQKLGHSIYSYVPLPEGAEEAYENIEWLQAESFAPDWEEDTHQGRVLINYRTPNTFSVTKRAGDRFIFISEDVDYPWTKEQLEKVDRYVTLCPVHAMYTRAKYPEIKDRIAISSNGIKSAKIKALAGKFPREPHRMFYASSPDRGLEFLLTHWWRVKERFSDATLYVAYGWENVDTIVNAYGGNDWRAEFKARMGPLLHQDGITWLGRLPQERIWEQHYRASVWPAPHSFPETSCITCMESQACGSFPVTNNFWALIQNVQWGWKMDGIPQNDEMLRQIWLNMLFDALERNTSMEAERAEMQDWALKEFDWSRMVSQVDVWCRE